MKSIIKSLRAKWLATTALGLAIAALSITQASATIYTWSGASTANNAWSNKTNWNPNTAAPTTGDIVVFKNFGSPQGAPNEYTTHTFSMVWFTNGGSSFSGIQMGDWKVANGVAGVYTNILLSTNANSGGEALKGERVNRTFYLPSGTNIYQNDSLGTLYLYGNGNMTIQAYNGNSTLVVDGVGNTVFGANSSGAIVPFYIANGGGVLKLVKNGSGRLTLISSVTNSSTGGFTLNAGTLVINNAGNPSGSGLSTNSAIGTGTFTINGGAIDNTSGGDLTLTTANPQVWNGDFAYAGSMFNIDLGSGAVTLSNSVQVTVSNNILSVGGVIGGSGFGITKAGPGTLTLNGANTYTGNTTINAGTLTMGASGSLSSASTVNIGAGGTFDVSSQSTWTLGSSASLTASGSASAAQINGGTTVNLGSRPITLDFDGVNSALTVASGALTINGGITVSNASGSALNNGTYTLVTVNSGTITGTPYLAGPVSGAGIVGGSGAAIQVSGGQIQLVVQTAVATTTTIARHTGTTSSSTYGSALQFDVTVTGSTPTGIVTIKDGGAGGTTIGTGTLSGGSATVTLSPLNSLAVGSHANIVAVYNGDGGNQGSTSSALSPAQSVNVKALTISGATVLSKYYDGTTNATLTGTLSGIISGDTVTLNGTGYFANAGPGAGIAMTSTSTLGGASAGNYTLTEPTGLTGTIYSSGTPGVWTGTAGTGLWETPGNWNNNAVPSGFNVTADFSTLDITSDQTVNLTTAETVGNLIFGDSNTNTAAGWSLSNNGNLANTLTLASATPTITVNSLGGGKTAAISAVVAGNSGLTKTGNGTLALNAANTYTGTTTISAGTAKAGNANAFGANTVLTVQSGAALDLNGQNLNNLNFTVVAGGAGPDGNGVIINSSATQAASAFSNLVMTADTVVGGTGGWVLRASFTNAPALDMGGHTLTKVGVNTVTLLGGVPPGAVVNPGNILVNTGILQLGFAMPDITGAASQSNCTITVNSGATLDLYKNSANVTYGVVLSNATFSVSVLPQTGSWTGPMTLKGTDAFLMNSNGVYKGPIGGAGNLVKTGAAVFSMLGTNTYYGNTAVSNGTLEVGYANFAPNSTISVASGGVLQLDLAVTNAVTNLVLNGVSQALGLYNSNNVPTYITGAGSLEVVAGPVAPAVPTFTPPGGAYTSAQTVLISSSAGSTVTYTTDGSNPSSSGTAVTVNNPATVIVPANVTETLKAFASMSGLNSAVATATYTTITVPTTPTNITVSASSGVLTLAWPSNYLGWYLQAQTNALNTGLSTNWVTIPGSQFVTSTNLPISLGNGSVFYRMVYTNTP